MSEPFKPEGLGPNSGEVLAFEAALKQLSSAAWKRVQSDAPPLTYAWLPALNRMKAVGEENGRTAAMKEAGYAAFAAFPWDLGAEGWERTGINPKICSDCASIAGQAIAIHDGLDQDTFRELYGPFCHAVPRPGVGRPPWLASGCAAMIFAFIFD